ncbi:TIGR02757 family protein [Robertkochia solimangrovi]|uniref:TIGR02757 family protein n=1 Tax=Robertkochia solimangrovi TaxID=2213046 RepID=UPI00117C822B|nr:TIGR02757 family protein [Robertkochia solimangrovi]TRZ45445.1 TIGR02757 family protein [Robertkochia solimangrovi]
MPAAELKEFLDEKADFYNNPDFITSDPIQIPHKFRLKEDIEISGFLAATIAWGNRKSIINNAEKMMELMGDSPYDFIMNHKEEHLERLLPFVHRTFNGHDLIQFTKSLQHIYKYHGGLEMVFVFDEDTASMQEQISKFKELFFETEHLERSKKHISDPAKGSAAKRINMFLRWMARKDNKGVDLGIWKTIDPAHLSCPLDVHSGGVARKLGILKRKQNDAKALKELDDSLRALDPSDPVKYDFALFGLGVFEKF